MAEWPKAVASKAIILILIGIVGSNPTLSSMKSKLAVCWDSVMQKRSFSLLFASLFFSIKATFIDNRFFPFFPENYKRTYERRSTLDNNFFMMFAHSSRNDEEKEVGLFEMFGKYDLTQIAISLEAVGKPNPLKPEWRANPDLVFDFNGKLDTQGFWIASELALIKNQSISLSIGERFAIMHVSSRQNFIISDAILRDLHLDEGGKILLDQERRESSDILGVCEFFSDTGCTDFDLYLRLGQICEYIYKCRLIDYGLSLGILIPTGMPRDINNAASFPFSSNDHFGIYGLIDVSVEFKEDWFMGGWMDFVHRFPKTQCLRVPYDKEPLEFGAITGNFNVDPGFTLGWAIFFKILDFNHGLGGKLKYTMIKHFSDKFEDKRLDKITIPFNQLDRIVNLSSWMSEFFTVELLYSINHAIPCKRIDPYFYVNFDAPVRIFGEENVARTFKLSIGFEVNF